MNVDSALYVGNTTISQLTLTDRAGNPITDATVTLESLEDADGNSVSGLSVPLSMPHTAGGVYEGTIPATAGIVAGKIYSGVMKAVAGSQVGQWTETGPAQVRHA